MINNFRLFVCTNIVILVMGFVLFLFPAFDPVLFVFIIPVLYFAYHSLSRHYLPIAVLLFIVSIIVEGYKTEPFWVGVGQEVILSISLCAAAELIYTTNRKRKETIDTLRSDYDELTQKAQESTFELTKINNELSKEVNERKKITATLKENEALLRTIIDLVPHPIFAKDKNGIFLFANQAIAVGMDTTPDEMVGKHQLDITPNREEARQYIADDLEVIHTGKQKLIPIQYYTDSKGKRHVYRAYKIPFPMPGTNTPAVLGVAVDITDIVETEAALRKSEEKYRELVQSANSMILRMDRDTRVTFFNEYAQDFFGYSEEEIIGKSVMGTIVPETDSTGKHLTPIIKAVCRSPERYFRNENENMCKNGKRVQVEWVNRGIYTPEGESIGVLSIGNDVTQIRQLQEQLIQSQKMESIGRLAGGIAHDFNNILTVITGYSDSVLTLMEEDNAYRNDLQEIKKAGERAAMMTQQLLAFSRKQVMKPEILDVGELIQAMKSMLCRLIGEHIDFVTEFPETVGRIKEDRSQMEQVIMNLAVNARDAMPSGGKLCIQLKNVKIGEAYNDYPDNMKPGNYVQVEVEDNGTGMDPEQLTHIFEPFYTTKEEGKGTGLGLSTVYGIIRQSGGYIFAHSEPKKGTTIAIFLPQATVEAPPAKVESAAPLEYKGNETILLSEDNDSVRKLIGISLEEYGYTVIATGSGVEALEVASSDHKQIDLLITDMIMPKMNGRELAVKLRQTHPETKILITSGYTRERIVSDELSENEFTLLQKPFSKKQLLHTVRTVLNMT